MSRLESEHAESVDRDPQRELRELLNLYKQDLGASNTELAEGLGVSRPKLIRFMNTVGEELSLKKSHLIKLHNTLAENKTNRDVSQIKPTARLALQRRGPDELLETAGFLSVKGKSIRVTRERFALIAQIITLLDSSLLPWEEMVLLVQDLLTSISSRLHLKEDLKTSPDNDNAEKGGVKGATEVGSQPLISIKNYLREDRIANLRFIKEVEENLDQAIDSFDEVGKTIFSEQEAIGLYRSIVTKKLMQDEEPPIRIKVIKVEFQTISLVLTPKPEYEDVFNHMLALGGHAEKELKTKIETPVTKASVTCSFGFGTPDKTKYFTWGYASCSTLLAIAISACAFQIGYCDEVAAILVTCRTLGSTVDALVETTVVLGKKYQGIWVDRDLVKSVLQALVNAGKYWLGKSSDQEFDLQKYVNVCEKLSDLRERLSTARYAFHEFNFFDDTCNPDIYIGIANDAKELLNSFPVYQEPYYRHSLELYRFYIVSKRMQLRHETIQGNIIESKRLIEEIKDELSKIESQNNEQVLNELIPCKILLESEILLYSLSSGLDLFNDPTAEIFPFEYQAKQDTYDRDDFLKSSDSRNKCLQAMHDKIVNALDPKVLYQDPGIDTYLALSEIYGNTARFDFYLSNDAKELKKAVENCLQAAHYALRVGAKQRTSRWLALAGRLQVRLGDKVTAYQLYTFAKEVAQINPHPDERMQQAILSEVQILKGEIFVVLEDNSTAALPHFLQALRGATYLAFNRRIADALYNISRCSERLGSVSINEIIDENFNNFNSLDEIEKRKLNPSDNITSYAVIDLLKKVSHDGAYSSWRDTQVDFLSKASEIWQKWHDTAALDSNSRYPISLAIQEKRLLCPVL